MLPIATKNGGQAIAFPDVCMTPIPAPPGGAPVPYPNTASPSSADHCTVKVLVSNKAVVVEGSEIPRSQGDEAGVATTPSPKGLKSQGNMGKVVWKQHSSKVEMEGQGVVLHLAPTAHNGANANAVGTHVTPSQTKVLAGS